MQATKPETLGSCRGEAAEPVGVRRGKAASSVDAFGSPAALGDCSGISRG